MEQVSMQAIGEQCVTFLAAEGALEGAVCKLSGNAEVTACADGDEFCGVCGKVRGGATAVILHGYVQLPYSGAAPAVGYAQLLADGEGGVRAATGDEAGQRVLVVDVNTTDKLIGAFL